MALPEWKGIWRQDMGYTHYFTVKETLDAKLWRKFLREVKTLLKAMPAVVTYRYWDEEKYEAAKAASPSGFVGPNVSCMSERDVPLKLFGGNGVGSPVFNDESIVFNGDDREGLGHETFLLSRNGVRNFCKTALKPYDLAVCLVLMSLAHHFPGQVSVRSDGRMDEWAQAFDLYTTVTGRKPPLMEVQTRSIEVEVWSHLQSKFSPLEGLMDLVDDKRAYLDAVKAGFEQALSDTERNFDNHKRAAAHAKAS